MIDCLEDEAGRKGTAGDATTLGLLARIPNCVLTASTRAVAILSIGATLAIAPPALSQTDWGTRNPHIVDAFKHDTSPRLDALPPSAPTARLETDRLPHDFSRRGVGLVGARADTLAWAPLGPAAPIEIGPAFNSLQDSMHMPGDASGAPGFSQYVLVVNNQLVVYDKSIALDPDSTRRKPRFGPVPIRTLWRGFGTPCEERDDGDPIVRFDVLAKRWIVSQFQTAGRDTPGGTFGECIAVSVTDDALGQYYRYEFRYPDFNDYPKLGVWPDAYYVSFNLFPPGGSAHALACAYDRAQMLAGAPAHQVCFELDKAYQSLMPVDLEGATLPGPGITAGYFFSLGADAASLNYWRLRIDWHQPSASTFGVGAATAPDGNVPVHGFHDACLDDDAGACIPQSGTPQRLDAVGERLMYRAALRVVRDTARLVLTHSIQGPAGVAAALRWYEMVLAGDAVRLFQQGSLAPDANSRWLGSITMDKEGNIGLGYNISSGAMHPSARITGRTPTYPLGSLGTDSPPQFTLLGATGSQVPSADPADLPEVAYRWGDYSSLTVDPVDGCTFWFPAEFHPFDGQWNWMVRVVTFKFASCAPTDANRDRGVTTVSGGETTFAAPFAQPAVNEWGSSDGGLRVIGDSIILRLACAHVIFSARDITLRRGFEAVGRFVQEASSVTRTVHAIDQSARVSSRVVGDTMFVDIVVTGAKEHVYHVALRRGEVGRPLRCLG